MSKSYYKLESMGKNDEGEFFRASILIPTAGGWIDEVTLHADNLSFPLKYERVIDDKALFTSEIFLPTKALFKCHYSYKIEGRPHHTLTFKTKSNFEVPDWTKGKIMYHIFVDRFNKGRDEPLRSMPNRTTYSSFNEEMKVGPINEVWNADFYGGDIEGIIKKLEYIKSLGVSILYLSPLVWSQSNHRYDTSDYENVDPYVGNNRDFKRLCEIAHSMDMKIVLDAVFNHTGNDSIYFNELGTFNELGAYQSKESRYNSFFKRNEDGTFSYWWGMKNLPVCDSNSKEWIDYITGEGGIIDKWFELGIDGLRLDVADELSDTYIEHIRTAVKRNKEDGFIIGEVWKNPMDVGRSYISSGKAMDSVMNYYFIDALIRYFKYEDHQKLKKVLDDIKHNYPEEIVHSLMNFTSTHDISRAINIFGSDEFDSYAQWAWDLKNEQLEHCRSVKLTDEERKKGKEIFKSYLFSLTFLPGILSIFYGDEIGIDGLGNLANRKPFLEDKKDQELLDYFRFIGSIRRENPFLEKADFRVRDINPNFFMFERFDSRNSATIVVNRTPQEHQIILPKEGKKEKIYTLNNSRRNNLTPYGAVAVIKGE